MRRRHWWNRVFTTWNPRAEVARIEGEWCTSVLYSPTGDIPDGLLSEYSDGDEQRALGPALQAAAAYGRRQDWARCIPGFRDVNLRDDDWDIPYLWFANFLDSKGRTAPAITLVRNASTYCRRKSVLLRKAGELCLFNGEVHLSLHLLAQAVAANPVPPKGEDIGYQGVYCYLEVILEELGDPEGAAWASNVQNYSYIDDSLKNRIRDAVAAASVADRALLLEEAPKISAALSSLM